MTVLRYPAFAVLAWLVISLLWLAAANIVIRKVSS